MNAGIWSLLPAVITILVALATHRVAWALFAGVLGGAFTFANMSSGVSSGISGDVIPGFAATFVNGVVRAAELFFLSFSDIERLKIAFFIICVGGLLEIISASGAYKTFAGGMARYLRTPRRTRVTVFFLSLSMFFDDYAGLLISGASMRPIIRAQGISPTLFAYIVDQTATMVSIVFLSTWAAFEGSLLASSAGEVGSKLGAVELLLRSLPFHFATWSGVWLAFLSARSGAWFSGAAQAASGKHVPSMNPCEAKVLPALQISDVPHAAHARETGNHGRMSHVVLPMGLLIGASLGGLLGAGVWKARNLPPEQLGLMEILGDAPTVSILLCATILALVGCLYQMRRDRLLSWSEIRGAFVQGAWGMVPACMVILLAKGLSEISTQLGTGIWLTGLCAPFAGPTIVPAMLFVVAVLITIATGFSWSSMAILMPVAFKMAMAQPGGEALLPIVSGAVISGAIAGGLLIPYSDTSVMASTACGITPVLHARTQAPQILISLAFSTLGYLLLGIGVPTWAALGSVLVGVTVVHAVFARRA
ncbi:MAG: Na+/H+ antiporter NhaC family protein [Candidatus Ozemobacteraceae bacterium]